VEAKEDLNGSTFHAPTHSYVSVYSLMKMTTTTTTTTTTMMMMMMMITLQERNTSE
jgi:hypothetical protein